MACLVSEGGMLVFLENQNREIQNAFNIKPHFEYPLGLHINLVLVGPLSPPEPLYQLSCL